MARDSKDEVDADEDADEEERVGEIPENWWFVMSVRFPFKGILTLLLSKRNSDLILFNCCRRRFLRL